MVASMPVRLLRASEIVEGKTHRYLRTPAPVHFPASEEVPETNRHLEQRTALYQILKRELAASATIGSDQFVYWDPTTAKKRLAPDVFVRLDAPHRPFRTWKCWQRGTPELGVEIVSDADEREDDWNEKLARYHAAGFAEVVRFDAEDAAQPIRVWDLLDGDLVERAPDDPDLRYCETLGLWWVVVVHEALGRTLRLARYRNGRKLLPTPEEETAQARAETEKARTEKAKAREEAAKAREEAAKARAEKARLEAEIEALRAELAGSKKRGGKAR
jgi:hypothetical protein